MTKGIPADEVTDPIDDVEPPSCERKKKRRKQRGYSIPRSVFNSIVREIAYKHNTSCRFSPEALEALREAGEARMVECFQGAREWAEVGRAKTVGQKHLRAAVGRS